MKFLKITSSKYTGPQDYTLRKGRDGSFSVFKGNTLTQWGSNFPTVRSAENFLDRHDYIHASTDKIAISKDDLEALKEIYHLEETRPGVFQVGDMKVVVPEDFDSSHQVLLQFAGKNPNKDQIIADAQTLFTRLDELLLKDIYANVIFASTYVRGSNLEYIFAKKSKKGAGGAASRLKKSSSNFEKRDRKKSSREVSRNLNRVKSSNVWAYGIDIVDNDAKEGDVYVQFKNKEGGPGDTYIYYDVDLMTWKKVLSYPSKGAAVWKFLRNNFYYSKLTGDKKGKLPNAINH